MEKTLRILIIDDEPIVGQRLKPALEKSGYEVEVYADPVQAMKRIEETVFDIVVTDIRMDEVDGLQILEAATRRSKHTKVIIITGYATLELARESLSKGAFDFIAKPFKFSEIRGAVQKAADALAASPNASS